MNKALDVAGFIDRRGVGGFQILVLALCLIVMIIDGFDAQAVGFVAPLISMEWAVPKASFSAVFAAGLLGMALGALLFGALADRFGRKIILVLCLLAFGALTIGKAFASSTLALTVLQLLAGLGIGGAMPNAIALVSEYAPVKRRSLMIAVATAGYSVGASGAGFLTARLAAVYGWRATFLVGGIAALAMVPALIALLPESIRFMALSGAQHSKLISILRKIDPRLPAQLDFTLTSWNSRFFGVGPRLAVTGGVPIVGAWSFDYSGGVAALIGDRSFNVSMWTMGSPAFSAIYSSTVFVFNADGFAALSYKFTPNLKASVGLRADYYNSALKTYDISTGGITSLDRVYWGPFVRLTGSFGP